MCQDIELLKKNIGKKVEKKSKCCFKSTFRKNTIKDVVEHPYVNGKIAYTFEEDDSCVEAKICIIID